MNKESLEVPVQHNDLNDIMLSICRNNFSKPLVQLLSIASLFSNLSCSSLNLIEHTYVASMLSRSLSASNNIVSIERNRFVYRYRVGVEL